MKTKAKKSRCKGQTKAGARCGAAATAGGLCFFHANPNKASELGRIGGRRKGRTAAENSDPLPALNNALAVRNVVSRLIDDVYSGKLHPRVAAGLAPLLNLQMRAIEATDLEQRVAKLEKLLSEAEADTDGKQSMSELDFGDLPMPSQNLRPGEVREEEADEVRAGEEA